ncbi:hypothetical protein [Actinokineospora globicatena]|uniref:Uncharacterized protein n=1 Tax=Actinokineospora globicatena TaxID=103729 RepID=A0A9W6QQE4_9PSEU|nr:hypothetical protein [Actinokineospora globicatena]MCP2305213.1 hypothetical protein [Actinokineospora globicatena]GLW80688.1 hypothetical protein Aglo01_51690 [Actinokineospora globicatena]GLW87515.1 hypothetical protein Aglo02_51540 [Actinokineospora globicatena]GLW93762.1 hypothetical protein Aglo03_45780 [Actinokineospora globicatena]
MAEYVLSEFDSSKVNTPKAVLRWQQFINAAPDVEAAQAQALYHVLVQLRAIKLVLIWTLIILPAAGAVLLLILLNQGAADVPDYRYR